MERIAKSKLFIISLFEHENKQTAFEMTETPGMLSLPDNFKDVKVNGFFTINGKKVFIEVRLETECSLKCARCGKEFKQHIDAKYRFLFLPEEKRNYKEEESVDLFFYDRQEVNFADQIRDSVLLEIPVKPLCKENCEGIDY